MIPKGLLKESQIKEESIWTRVRNQNEKSIHTICTSIYEDCNRYQLKLGAREKKKLSMLQAEKYMNGNSSSTQLLAECRNDINLKVIKDESNNEIGIKRRSSDMHLNEMQHKKLRIPASNSVLKRQARQQY
jgi:hypothetical protein